MPPPPRTDRGRRRPALSKGWPAIGSVVIPHCHLLCRSIGLEHGGARDRCTWSYLAALGVGGTAWVTFRSRGARTRPGGWRHDEGHHDETGRCHPGDPGHLGWRHDRHLGGVEKVRERADHAVRGRCTSAARSHVRVVIGGCPDHQSTGCNRSCSEHHDRSQTTVDDCPEAGENNVHDLTCEGGPSPAAHDTTCTDETAIVHGEYVGP